MHRPLFGIGILFALGVCLERFIHIPFFLLYVLAIFIISLGLLFLKHDKPSTICIIFFYLFLGCIFYSNTKVLASDHISKLNFLKNQTVLLKGIIVSEPKLRPLNRINKTNFILQAKEIKLFDKWYRISGKVLVNSYAQYDFSYADYLILEGKLFKPINFYLGAKLTYSDYLLSQGIHFIFSVKKNSSIERIAKNQANFLKIISLKAKKGIERIIQQNLPFLEASILEAIILGERGNLSKEINNLFVQTGTAHILAISGLHIGIVVFIVLIFLKALRIERRTRFCLTIIFLIIYAILTGSRPSVIRASTMAIILLIGILMEKEIDIYSSLSFAALIILMISPQTLFDVGFQLSFASVISIVSLTKRIETSILRLLNSNSRILTFFVRSISVSLSAWIGVAGMIAYYFNILSPVTLLANLVVVPFMLIVVASGFCLIAAGLVLPAVAFIFGSCVKLCLDFLVNSAYLFSRLPGAYFYLNPFSLYQVLSYYLVIFLIFGLVRTSSSQTN